LIHAQPYARPTLLFSGHLETIYPALLRRVPGTAFLRERIRTDDDDFLDIDWLVNGSDSVVIISHGLEGNTDRAYIRGMARACFQEGHDVLAWNFRGCGQEMNTKLRFYHSGETGDLDCVVHHALRQGYRSIHLVGFSLGGNLTLKYLGERTPHAAVKKAVAISVPLDLHNSCRRISAPGNKIYATRFLKSLKQKVVTKSRLMPGLDTSGIKHIRTLMEFDDRFTAPLHGFQNATDYYSKCSALNYLQAISIPTLIINAANDPFLSASCYPVNELHSHPWISFVCPAFGGHVGFSQFGKNGLYWSEEQTVYFVGYHGNPKTDK
jgi:predicted alpha/beta-fold hydrolase